MKLQRVSYEQFLTKFNRDFKPSQHIAVISSTGSGKSYLILSLINYLSTQNPKYRIIFLELKTGDSLIKTQTKDYYRIPNLIKFSDISKLNKAGKFILGKPSVKSSDVENNFKTIERNFKTILDRYKNCIFIIDETQIFGDYGIGGKMKTIEYALISARSNNNSIVCLSQAPRFIPTASIDQASYLFISRINDIDILKKIADKIGENYKDLQNVVNTLDQYYWICLPQDKYKTGYIFKPELSV